MSAFSAFTDKDRKRAFNVTTTTSQTVPQFEYERSTSIPGNDQSDEIERKKAKVLPVFPTRNILLDYLTKPDMKTFARRRMMTPNESYQGENIEAFKTEHSNDGELLDVPEKNNFSASSTQVGIVKNKVIHSDNTESPSSSPIKSLLALSTVSSNYIKEDYVSEVHRIITSWATYKIEQKKTNETKSLDSSTKLDAMSKLTSLNHRRSYPQFESVRTPAQECQSSIPFELLDCCRSNPRTPTDDNCDRFRMSMIIRARMMDISKRLSKMYSLPMVDTHCHFDLIFDRLYIKHNNMTKYFDDYKDFYPPGLSLEFAIQVFWRPRHLTAENWLQWYSKYLDDDRVYGSCGIHPHWSSAWNEDSRQDIERCLQHPKVVAIGEIGLDFGPKNTCDIKQQCRVFEEQLKIAAKWSKPIVIHSRNAYQQTFEIMKQNLEANHRIHLHCFVGTIEDVQLFTSYFTEIKFGFTPLISYGTSLHPVIQQLRLEQILSETDSPYFVPEELGNISRCAHPSMVYSVIEIIARLHRISLTEVACQLRKNVYQTYGV